MLWIKFAIWSCTLKSNEEITLIYFQVPTQISQEKTSSIFKYSFNMLINQYKNYWYSSI